MSDEVKALYYIYLSPPQSEMQPGFIRICLDPKFNKDPYAGTSIGKAFGEKLVEELCKQK
jgi:hypothetical protein